MTDLKLLKMSLSSVLAGSALEEHGAQLSKKLDETSEKLKMDLETMDAVNKAREALDDDLQVVRQHLMKG
jgi:hypothetical protein